LAAGMVVEASLSQQNPYMPINAILPYSGLISFRSRKCPSSKGNNDFDDVA